MTCADGTAAEVNTERLTAYSVVAVAGNEPWQHLVSGRMTALLHSGSMLTFVPRELVVTPGAFTVSNRRNKKTSSWKAEPE